MSGDDNASPSDARVLKRAASMPDEFTFIDEHGNPLPEFGVLRLGFPEKVFVARRSLRWHKSVQWTMEHMVATACREYGRRRLRERAA